MPSTLPRRSFLALLLAIAATLCLPTGAHAAYSVESWPGCAGAYNSGSWDNAGNLYVPCGDPTTIGVFDSRGELVRSIDVTWRATDVAPTGDGKYLYLAGPSGPARLVRQANGSYAHDTAWSPAPYVMYGVSRPASGYNVAVDAAGNSYWSDGAWAANQTHTVLKYNPSGGLVTRFGEYGNTWSLGQFYWMLTGLTVTADGSTVYTTEVGNNRVQVWQRQASGAYSATRSVGGTAANNPDRGGYCQFGSWNGLLAAPYDVSADSAGNMYVINTTCKQVIKFTPGFGAVTEVVDVRLNGGDYPRPHGFAVAADGTVYVGENQKVLRQGSARPALGLPPARGGAPLAPSPAPAQPGTGGGSTGGGSTGGTTPRKLDAAPPRIEFALQSRKPRAYGRGQLALPTRVRCSESCTFRARIVLRIGAGKHARGITIASGTRSVAPRTYTAFPIKLTALGNRLLRGSGGSPIRPVAVLTVTDDDGTRRVFERAMRLR